MLIISLKVNCQHRKLLGNSTRTGTVL